MRRWNMKELIITCDKCGIKSTSGFVKEYQYSVGCEMDPSGNGYNECWEYVDLCENCKYDYAIQNPGKRLKSF